MDELQEQTDAFQAKAAKLQTKLAAMRNDGLISLSCLLHLA